MWLFWNTVQTEEIGKYFVSHEEAGLTLVPGVFWEIYQKLGNFVQVEVRI